MNVPGPHSDPTTDHAPTVRLAPSAGKNAALVPPERLQNYLILRLLGAGGMGVVYLAQQDIPKRQVALKLMRDAFPTPRLRARFRAEADALARLRHPNIAAIYEFGLHYEGPEDAPAEMPFYAMEYVPDAAPLTTYARHHALAPEARIRLFIKVCLALHHAHKAGLVHRDVKPANILVDPHGEPKLIDFGVARDLHDARTQHTQRGQLVGTLQYMAPEQVDPDAPVIDHRADVYSLGVVLYELLRAKLPYDLENVPTLKIPEIIRTQPPAQPRGDDPNFPIELQAILLAALHKDRARRYQTAADLADDLDRFLTNRPIRASGDSLTYMISTRVRAALADHAALALALGVAAAALLSTFLVAPLVLADTSALALQRLGLALAPHPVPPAALEHVRMVALTEQTDLARLANAERLAAFDPADVRSRRPLDARLLERLARASPRAVAWDITYRGETEADHLLRRAAELDFAGTGVVFAADTYANPLTPGGPPAKGGLERAVRTGAAFLTIDEDQAWFIELAAGSPTRPARALSIETFAVARDPRATVHTRIDERRETLLLRTDAGPWAGAPPVLIPAVTLPQDADLPAVGLRTGDLVAVTHVELPPPEALARATVDYQRVLEADEDTLRDWFGGKVVVVGSTRPDAFGRIDRHPYRARAEPGFAGHAGALELLLTHYDLRRTGPLATTALAVACALPALVLGWRVRTDLARLGLLALGALVALAIGLVLLQAFDLLVNPLALVSAILLALAVSAAVRRARPVRLA